MNANVSWPSAHRLRTARFSGAGSPSSLFLVLRGVSTMRHGGANAVGIGPVEMHEMLVGLRDVDEHSG